MWESGSLTTGAATTAMQSVCSPIARCWDGMHSIKSKTFSGLGVLTPDCCLLPTILLRQLQNTTGYTL